MSEGKDGAGMVPGAGETGAQALDELLAEARAARPAPGAALMARVLADAAAETAARRRGPAAPAREGALRRALAAAAEAFGGARAAAGLAAAGLAGLAIGLAAPAPVIGLIDGLSGQSATLLPDDLPDVQAILGVAAGMAEGEG